MIGWEYLEITFPVDPRWEVLINRIFSRGKQMYDNDNPHLVEIVDSMTEFIEVQTLRSANSVIRKNVLIPIENRITYMALEGLLFKVYLSLDSAPRDWSLQVVLYSEFIKVAWVHEFLIRWFQSIVRFDIAKLALVVFEDVVRMFRDELVDSFISGVQYSRVTVLDDVPSFNGQCLRYVMDKLSKGEEVMQHIQGFLELDAMVNPHRGFHYNCIEGAFPTEIVQHIRDLNS